MSLTLFNIFIDGLFERVRREDHGLMVEGRRLGCLGFADDIVLMSASADGLQCMVWLVRGEIWGVSLAQQSVK